ncbi:MAG: hypothetical protein QXY99_01305 [Thermoproteota archaeon]
MASQAWKIVISVGLMVIVGFTVPAGHVVTASRIILGVGVAMNLLEVGMDVYNAYKARDEMNALANKTLKRAMEYLAKNNTEHAKECFELARRLRIEANATINNLGINVLSELFVDVTWDEVSIALGWKEPLVLPGENRDYKVGYATGRVAGAIVLCMLYGAFYAMVTKIKAERIMGEPLSVSQILRLMGRGIYNWITPAIWDAVVLMRGKIGGFASSVVDLLLGNKYSSRFGEAVGSLLNDARGEFPRVGDTLDASSGISKHVLENVPSRESSSRILDAIGSIVENYSPEELKEKGKIVTRSIVSMWIKDGDSAIDSLNNWLSENVGDIEKMRALDNVLCKVGEDATKGVGAKIGDIVDDYLEIKSKYDEDVAEAFLDAVLRNPNALGEVLAGIKDFDFASRPREVTLKRGEKSALNMGEGNELDPGTYVARIYWKYGEKKGMIEFPIRKDVKSGDMAIPKHCIDQVLNEIGKDEAKVSITGAEFFDYRLFFPREFPVSGKRIEIDLFYNEMRIDGRNYRFKPNTDVRMRGLRVDAEFEGKHIGGKNLLLSFYEDGEVGIKYGERSYPIEEISVEASLELMRIKYREDAAEYVAEYSFNLRSLSEQMGEHSYEIPVGGQKTVRLKEELFRLLGYDALRELEDRIGNVDDEERGVMLFAHFDNGKVAYCGSEELRVRIPPEAEKITKIEIIPFKELSDLKKDAMRVLKSPQNTRLKGKLGEAIVEGESMDEILTEIAERSGISKGKLIVIPTGDSGTPDFKIEVSGTGERIAVIEVKYVWDPENIEEFERQLNGARRADQRSF